MTRWIRPGIPVVFALIVGLMSISGTVHSRFDWVPVNNSNIVLDSTLKLVLGIVLIAVGVTVILPLTLALHMIGHAVAGHLIGMRLLAVRLGPLLFTPLSVGSSFVWLGVHSRQDLTTGWVQFDDSPLPNWKQQRAWQVMAGGGSAMNLLCSFLCAMASIMASGVLYVLLRQAVWLSLAVAVTNLVPFVWPRFGYVSDGKRLLTLVLDEGDGADVLMEQLRDEVVVGPIRPASWPRERESAWETKLRQMPATHAGRADQLETMIYLFLQAADRGDQAVAWRWVQAMHHVLGADPDDHDISAESGRVMCALHAARWEKNAESAVRLLSQIRIESGMQFSPWYTVARAATSYAEANLPDVSAQEKLAAAMQITEVARTQLEGPAKLHGVDQFMLGIAESIRSDAEIDLQKLSYQAGAAGPAKSPLEEALARTAAA